MKKSGSFVGNFNGAFEQLKTTAVPAVVKLPFTGIILPRRASKEFLIPLVLQCPYYWMPRPRGKPNEKRLKCLLL